MVVFHRIKAVSSHDRIIITNHHAIMFIASSSFAGTSGHLTRCERFPDSGDILYSSSGSREPFDQRCFVKRLAFSRVNVVGHIKRFDSLSFYSRWLTGTITTSHKFPYVLLGQLLRFRF